MNETQVNNVVPTMAPAKVQAMRERGQACLVTGLCLGAVAVGIAASPEGNRYLAIGFGLAALMLVCAFGILWDNSSPLAHLRKAEPWSKADVAKVALTVIGYAALIAAFWIR